MKPGEEKEEEVGGEGEGGARGGGSDMVTQLRRIVGAVWRCSNRHALFLF